MKSQHSNQENRPVVDVVTVATNLDYEVECQAAFVQLATYATQWRRQLATPPQAPIERSYQVAMSETTDVSTIHLLSESANALQVIRQDEADRYVVTDFNLESGVVRQGSVNAGDDLDDALLVADRGEAALTLIIDTARIMYDCNRQEKRRLAI